MKRIVQFLVVVASIVLGSLSAFAGGSNPGLYYGQVPTAAQWNSYFSAKLDYTPGAVNTLPYWDGAGSQLNALVSGDCTSAANVFTCTKSGGVAFSSALGSSLIGHSAAGAGATTRTVQSKLRDIVNIADYGAACNGTTDDTAAINAAFVASLNVEVSSGCTALISSTITSPLAGRLHFNGAFGNQTGAYPASYFIKKSTMTTPAIIMLSRAWIDGGGVVGQAGNTGDGISIQGNGVKVSNSFVHLMGGDGVRVGNAAGANVNSFQMDHVNSEYNGGHGFNIHDGTAASPANANAGLLVSCVAVSNTGDGFHIGHAFWTTIINGLAEVNTGWGLQTSDTVNNAYPESRNTNIIGGDFNEGNTAGIVKLGGYFDTFENADPAQTITPSTSGLQGAGIYTRLGGDQGLGVGGTTLAGFRSYAYPSTIDVDGGGTTLALTIGNTGPQAANRGTTVNLNVSGSTGLGVNGTRAGAQIQAANAFAATQGAYLQFNTENTAGTLTTAAILDQGGNLTTYGSVATPYVTSSNTAQIPGGTGVAGIYTGSNNAAITSTVMDVVAWQGASDPLNTGGTAGSLLLASRNLAGTTINFSTQNTVRGYINSSGYNGAVLGTVNGNTFTTGSSTYTGTAGQTYTFPATTASIARTDAAQTFTGAQTFATSIVGGSAHVLYSATAPAIASGFGTGSTVPSNNGTATFNINVGTGGTASSGVVTMPAATTGWNCIVKPAAAPQADSRMDSAATSTTSITITNYTSSTGAALAWPASTVIAVTCVGY